MVMSFKGRDRQLDPANQGNAAFFHSTSGRAQRQRNRHHLQSRYVNIQLISDEQLGRLTHYPFDKRDFAKRIEGVLRGNTRTSCRFFGRVMRRLSNSLVISKVATRASSICVERKSSFVACRQSLMVSGDSMPRLTELRFVVAIAG